MAEEYWNFPNCRECFLSANLVNISTCAVWYAQGWLHGSPDLIWITLYFWDVVTLRSKGTVERRNREMAPHVNRNGKMSKLDHSHWWRGHGHFETLVQGWRGFKMVRCVAVSHVVTFELSNDPDILFLDIHQRQIKAMPARNFTRECLQRHSS